MIYLIVRARGSPSALYYIQIGLMLAWLVLELFLDYMLKIDFRHIRWAVVVYVTLFFAERAACSG
jgi:hypothetical protein